jgi:hypothetical protein
MWLFIYIYILAVEAHIESVRMDAGSLDTIDQNVTDDQSGL